MSSAWYIQHVSCDREDTRNSTYRVLFMNQGVSASSLAVLSRLSLRRCVDASMRRGVVRLDEAYARSSMVLGADLVKNWTRGGGMTKSVIRVSMLTNFHLAVHLSTTIAPSHRASTAYGTCSATSYARSLTPTTSMGLYIRPQRTGGRQTCRYSQFFTR